MGESRPQDNHESEEEDLRDSQVGGWIGSFYAKYGKWGKSYDPEAPKSGLEDDNGAILEDI